MLHSWALPVGSISWITNALQQKELALSGYLINSITVQDYEGDFQQNFLELLELNPDKYSFKLTSDVSYSTTDRTETSMYVLESIVVQCESGEMDFIVADWNTFPCFTAYYGSLKEILPAEKLEQWQAHLVYAERKALQDFTSGDLDQEIVYPEYSFSDEGMTDPVPIGIRLPEANPLLQAYSFPAGDVILGITVNSQHTENTLAFLEYILN